MRTSAERELTGRTPGAAAGAWRSVITVAALAVGGAALSGALVVLPPDHPARIGGCAHTGTEQEIPAQPVHFQPEPCGDATADSRIIGLTEVFFDAQPECNDETDVVVVVKAFVVACSRRRDDRDPYVHHPGDVGRGGGILRPGDCLRVLGLRERACADPSAEAILLARVDDASQCPPATAEKAKLGGSRPPVACLGPLGPDSAAQVFAGEPVCPGCASKRRPVATVVAVVVVAAVATALLVLVAGNASARARRRTGALVADATPAVPFVTWWQVSGWGLRLAGSISLVLSGLGLLTFLQLTDMVSGPLTGARAAGATGVVFGLGAAWLTAVGTLLWRNGRRLGAPTAQQLMRRDWRPPVLYLRSFADDTVTSRQVVPLYPLFRRYSEEAQLARALGGAGPVVAIGRPNEQLPELGAARLYAADDEWQETVTALMGRASLVVVRAAMTSGLQWELQQILGRMPLEKLLLLIPFDAEEYGEFRTRLQPVLGVELPAFAPHPWSARWFASFRRITLRAAVYFLPDGSARWVPFWWSLIRVGPGSGVARNLRRHLRPALPVASPARAGGRPTQSKKGSPDPDVGGLTGIGPAVAG